MSEKLRRLWRDYNLSLFLFAAFLVSWLLQAWTGWRKFSAEQLQHQQVPSVFGNDGYVWEFLAATFENWQSEFLQLLAMVVLTSFLSIAAAQNRRTATIAWKPSSTRCRSSWTGWPEINRPRRVARRTRPRPDVGAKEHRGAPRPCACC
jgi:hypothetical protein